MKNIYNNKNSLIIIVLILLSAPFLYLLNQNPLHMTNISYWIVAYILTLLFLFLVFIISTSIQLVLIRILNIFKISTFSLYPFTYDGKFRFHPISLLYNIEGFSNSLILNLCVYIKDEDLLKKRLKELIWIRKFSIIVTNVIFFVIFHHYDWITVIVFLVITITTILLSYFRYGYFCYGYDYLYHSDISYLRLYLYSCKGIQFIPLCEYANAVMSKCSNLNLHLATIENYLYKCILKNQTMLSSEELLDLLTLNVEGNLNTDSKLMSILRLIGWVGIKCNDKSYISLSIDLLTQLKYSEDSYIRNNIDTHIQKEIDYLYNFQGEKECALQLMYHQNVFSLYENIFPRKS